MRVRRLAEIGSAALVAAVLIGAPAGDASATRTGGANQSLTPPANDADNATSGNYGWFQGGHAWHGEFADPTVVYSGGTYYAFSSAAGGRYLGVMTSTDLVHWAARAHWSTSSAPWLGGPNPQTDPSIPAELRAAGLSDGDLWNLNDAQVRPAAWGLTRAYNSWLRRTYWAVGVAQMGSTWYSYAAVQVSTKLGDGTTDPDGFGRYCLTLATAPGPLGPYRDVTGNAPLYCDPDPAGSIDPQPYQDPATGQWWLTWKANGRRSAPGVTGYPSALKTVRLDSHGRMSGPITTLLTTAEGTWEGLTIENPAMIKYAGRWYLFYSGNRFVPDHAGHSAYATGYAICSGPAGPCHRPSVSPLMRSGPGNSGPGGASAFVDVSGQLRLVYASFFPGEYRPTGVAQPRRMRLARLAVADNGTLSVALTRQFRSPGASDAPDGGDGGDVGAPTPRSDPAPAVPAAAAATPALDRVTRRGSAFRR